MPAVKLSFGEVLAESFGFFFANLRLFFHLVTIPWIISLAIRLVGSTLERDSLLPALLQKAVDTIPVVMFMGRHDYTTPSEPTAKWLQKVDAPFKKAVWFEHSAHMMPWEESGKTLVGLLQVVRPLAVDSESALLDGIQLPALRRD